MKAQADAGNNEIRAGKGTEGSGTAHGPEESEQIPVVHEPVIVEDASSDGDAGVGDGLQRRKRPRGVEESSSSKHTPDWVIRSSDSINTKPSFSQDAWRPPFLRVDTSEQ